jgi:hypothetical protein
VALLLGFGSLAFHPMSAGAQDVGKDVPPNHWAYEAIQDLAGKGLIKGYPPDGKFLGGRTLTRYEMASLIQRVVSRMDDLLQQHSKAEQDTLNSSLGEIRELVNGFKLELTVIGTDMERVKQDLDALKGQVGALGSRMGGLEDRVGGLTKRVDAANIAADQALTNIAQLKTDTNAALAKKVDVYTGKLRVEGLIQVWYGTAFGSTWSGATTVPASAGPASALFTGRNYGALGSPSNDTFRLRRGQVGLDGFITPRIDYRIMFDIAKTGTGSSGVLQDLWAAYQFTPRLRVEIGQQKPNLSEEGPRPNAQQLLIERSVMNELPPTVGRVGDVRDTGALLRYATGFGNLGLGIWDDNGATQNMVDNDRQKFWSYNAYLTAIRHLMIGVWGGTNVGDSRPGTIRDRAGATFLWQSGPHYFEVEGAYTRDGSTLGLIPATHTAPAMGTTIGMGGYALYAHRLSRRWQLVGRFDIWDPAYHGGTTTTGLVIPYSAHKMREYTLGITYYILKDSKLQFNYIREDPEPGAVAFFGEQRTLFLTNYQVSF